MSEHHPHDSAARECAGGCDSAADPIGADRRAFLKSSAVAVAAALLGLGARKAEAFAPLAFTNALGARGQTRNYAIPAADGAQIDKQNEVILVRWQNAVYAFALSCPHQNTALRWESSESIFRCPKHKSTYKPDGTFIQGRATRSMDRFSLKREGNNVLVDLDAVHEEDNDPNGWKAAFLKL